MCLCLRGGCMCEWCRKRGPGSYVMIELRQKINRGVDLTSFLQSQKIFSCFVCFYGFIFYFSFSQVLKVHVLFHISQFMFTIKILGIKTLTYYVTGTYCIMSFTHSLRKSSRLNNLFIIVSLEFRESTITSIL